LWLTASDWLRWHESWMNDPLEAINAEEVEKNVGDAYKTMHKSNKVFQEMPGLNILLLYFYVNLHT
jgi:dynein heavy chain